MDTGAPCVSSLAAWELASLTTLAKNCALAAGVTWKLAVMSSITSIFWLHPKQQDHPGVGQPRRHPWHSVNSNPYLARTRQVITWTLCDGILVAPGIHLEAVPQLMITREPCKPETLTLDSGLNRAIGDLARCSPGHFEYSCLSAWELCALQSRSFGTAFKPC